VLFRSVTSNLSIVWTSKIFSWEGVLKKGRFDLFAFDVVRYPERFYWAVYSRREGECLDSEINFNVPLTSGWEETLLDSYLEIISTIFLLLKGEYEVYEKLDSYIKEALHIEREFHDAFLEMEDLRHIDFPFDFEP